MSTEHDHPIAYCFLPGEKPIVEALIASVRSLLGRADITPKQIHYCGVLLHVLQRLPLVTPGVGIVLCLIQPNESSKFWMGLTVDDERFELDHGRSVYSEVGSDNESETEFLISPDGRSSDIRFGNLLGWVDMFQWMCTADEVKLDFEDFGNDDVDWDDDGDPELWNRIHKPETNEND